MSTAEDDVSARLDRIEARLDRLVAVLDNAEPMAAMAADAADEWIAGMQRRGVDVDRRVNGLAHLAETATEPATLDRLTLLLERMEQLEPVIELAATFQSTTGMVFDMADAQIARLQEDGIDPEARLGQVLHLATRITDPSFHAHLETLLDAAPALIAATRTGEVFGRAIDEVAHGESPQPVKGIFGLMRAMRDPHVQRAVGFAMAVARKVGERLPQLPART